MKGKHTMKNWYLPAENLIAAHTFRIREDRDHTGVHASGGQWGKRSSGDP